MSYTTYRGLTVIVADDRKDIPRMEQHYADLIFVKGQVIKSCIGGLNRG